MSDNERELTPEELEARREEINAHYEKMIPQLTVQLEYETLLTDIETQRAKRFQAQVAIANMMAPEPEEDEVPVKKLKRN